MTINNHEVETGIASKINDGVYDWQQARLIAELQDLSFKRILQIFGRIYESEQCINEGYCHGSI